MTPYAFPAAILSSWIIVAMTLWGVHLARIENSTGVEPKGATWWLIVFLLIGGFLFVAQAWENPFIYSVQNDLVGGLIGFGSAYFAVRFVASLRRGPDQPPKPPL